MDKHDPDAQKRPAVWRALGDVGLEPVAVAQLDQMIVGDLQRLEGIAAVGVVLLDRKYSAPDSRPASMQAFRGRLPRPSSEN